MPSNPNRPSNSNQVQGLEDVALDQWWSSFNSKSFRDFEGQTDINAETGEKRTYDQKDLYPQQEGKSDEAYAERLESIQAKEEEYRRTEEQKAYDASEFGQREQAAKAKFDQFVEQIENKVAAGVRTREQANYMIEHRANETINDINDVRQDFAKWADQQAVGTPEEQAQYQAWLEKRDAENQANLERTGRPLMKKRGKKVKNAAESQHHPLNDLTTTAELSNLNPSKLNNDTLRELTEIRDRLRSRRKQIAKKEAENVATTEVGNTTSTESQHRPLNELTTAELFNLDHSELENSGLRELIEAQDRLRSEREQNATEKNDNIDPNEIFNMSGEEIDNLSNNLSSAAEFAEVIKALSAEHRAIIAKLEAKLANNPDGSKEGQTDIDKTVKTPESISPEDADKTYEKAKKNSRVSNFFNRKILPIVLVATIGLSSVVGGISQYLNPDSAAWAATPETATSQSTDGENLETPIHYDYSDYLDFDHKSSRYNYGTDKSRVYGDEEQTKNELMDAAYNSPEKLASYVKGEYAKQVFDDNEQKALGIFDMTEYELDNFLSDPNNPEAATMQQKLFEALKERLDESTTRITFNLENEDEISHYIIYIDSNSDGQLTPDEAHLGYAVSARNQSPQANVERLIDGEWVKVLDLNLSCGFQPNLPVNKTPTVPFISEDSPTPDTPNPPIPDNPPDTSTKPKDAENLERIDKNANEDIADNTGTDEINITPTDEVSDDNITEEPSAEDYQGTGPEIAENDASQNAEPVQDQVSPGNDYSQNQGGANAGEYAPVTPDTQAQAKADASEIPQSQAPTGGQAIDDTLKDLGIN